MGSYMTEGDAFERWRKDWIYGSVSAIRNSPLLPKVVCAAKGTGAWSGSHGARSAVRDGRSHHRTSGVDGHLCEDAGEERKAASRSDYSVSCMARLRSSVKPFMMGSVLDGQQGRN